RQGGNAVDAAVAMAFALGVVDPSNNGLGGFGGFMVIFLAKSQQVVTIDYNTVAPLEARLDSFPLLPDGLVANDLNRMGYMAISVPGVLAGLAMALATYGTRKLEGVLEPAIDLAEKGFEASPILACALKEPHLAQFPETAKIFDGEHGTLLRLPDYAQTLRIIAEEGPRAFYEGKLAQAIVSHIKEDGGLLSLKDLAGYRPRILSSDRGRYRGCEIFTPGACSGGPFIYETLNILEGFDLAGLQPYGPESLHLIVEAMKLGWADRLRLFGDPDFAPVPPEEVTSKEHGQRLRAKINPAKALRGLGISDPFGCWSRGSTTHLSVVDEGRNMVALTQTLGPLWFGSGITIPGTGLVMNNGMALFDPRPGKPNSIAPRKRPLTNMTPTLVIKGGYPFLTLGTPGGRRIPTMVTNFLIGVIDYRLSIHEAITAPRFHCEVDEPVLVEEAVSSEVQQALRDKGHEVCFLSLSDFYGPASGIMVDPITGNLHGGADPRPFSGAIAGY
ncbi:MAG: gamma-glutamyltransferase, partial [candidate division NC10 bacterium]|nr:gamma-glutamyltransferase [candidate division NC10 bacterium]